MSDDSENAKYIEGWDLLIIMLGLCLIMWKMDRWT